MSDREKKLLVFFGIAGFIILNIIAVKFYVAMRKTVNDKHTRAVGILNNARKIDTERQDKEVAKQMDWLAQKEPKPTAKSEVQTAIYELCKSEAQKAGLTTMPPKQLDTQAEAKRNYQRANVEITMTGTNQALFQWFDRINMPDQFRITSHIQLAPNGKDKTQIDCTATVEQWFVPPLSSD